MVGYNATMTRDDSGFSLINFDNLLSLLAKSFAYPLHNEQVFSCAWLAQSWIESGYSEEAKESKILKEFYIEHSMPIFKQCWRALWIDTTIIGQWSYTNYSRII